MEIAKMKNAQIYKHNGLILIHNVYNYVVEVYNVYDV